MTLESLSSEEVSNIIRSIGNDYEEYGDMFESNDIDGSTIEALEIDEINDFVKDMNITNTVHRAKIKSTIKNLIRDYTKASTSADGININIANTNNNNVENGRFVTKYELKFDYECPDGWGYCRNVNRMK